ncbi:hypothetical protein ACHAQA_008978 [Verticillium albo-atrum]
MVDDRKKDHKSAGKKRESKKTDDGREHKSFRHQGSSKSSNKRKEPELRDDILYSDEATAGRSGEDGYTQSVKREEGEQGRKTHHSKRSKQTNKYVDQQEENGGYTGWGYTGSETTTKGKGRQVKEQLKDFNDKFYSQGKGGQY